MKALIGILSGLGTLLFGFSVVGALFWLFRKTEVLMAHVK